MIIYVFVIIAVRIMGKRQIGELSTHEFVITILISAVATIPIQENSIPLSNSLLPIMIFISLEIIESVLSIKSAKFREIIQGKPIFIIKDGVLQQNEMKRIRFTMNDLLDNLRQQDIFDISEVENAIVETNGKLSVQPKAENAPLTPKDLHLKVDESTVPITIITDGKPVTEYFGDEKHKESEIELIAENTGKAIKDIMLLTIDKNGKVYIINKDKS